MNADKLKFLIKKYSRLYGSCMAKRDSNLYVCGSWLGQKFGDNPRYFFLQAEKQEGIRAVWITKNPAVAEMLKKENHEVYMSDSKEGIWCQRHAGYVFTCTGVEDVDSSLIGGATLINFWHGVPLKKIMYDDSISNKDNVSESKLAHQFKHWPFRKAYVVSTSDVISKIYESAFRKTPDRILQWGQPRNDMFFDASLRGEKLFPGYKKVILYMPTHRNEGKTDINCNQIFDLDVLNEFCKKNDCLFLIKKHFYHLNDEPISAEYSNVKEITAGVYDAQELMYETDILISDYSSCYIDYLLLDRPVIYYNYDMDQYLVNDREMYFEYDAVTPGYKAKDFTQLFDCISNLVEKGIDEFAEDRNRVKNLFYGKEAQQAISTRIMEQLRELR